MGDNFHDEKFGGQLFNAKAGNDFLQPDDLRKINEPQNDLVPLIGTQIQPVSFVPVQGTQIMVVGQMISFGEGKKRIQDNIKNKVIKNLVGFLTISQIGIAITCFFFYNGFSLQVFLAFYLLSLLCGFFGLYKDFIFYEILHFILVFMASVIFVCCGLYTWTEEDRYGQEINSDQQKLDIAIIIIATLNFVLFVFQFDKMFNYSFFKTLQLVSGQNYFEGI